MGPLWRTPRFLLENPSGLLQQIFSLFKFDFFFDCLVCQFCPHTKAYYQANCGRNCWKGGLMLDYGFIYANLLTVLLWEYGVIYRLIQFWQVRSSQLDTTSLLSSKTFQCHLKVGAADGTQKAVCTLMMWTRSIIEMNIFKNFINVWLHLPCILLPPFFFLWFSFLLIDIIINYDIYILTLQLTTSPACPLLSRDSSSMRLRWGITRHPAIESVFNSITLNGDFSNWHFRWQCRIFWCADSPTTSPTSSPRPPWSLTPDSDDSLSPPSTPLALCRQKSLTRPPLFINHVLIHQPSSLTPTAAETSSRWSVGGCPDATVAHPQWPSAHSLPVPCSSSPQASGTVHGSHITCLGKHTVLVRLTFSITQPHCHRFSHGRKCQQNHPQAHYSDRVPLQGWDPFGAVEIFLLICTFFCFFCFCFLSTPPPPHYILILNCLNS